MSTPALVAVTVGLILAGHASEVAREGWGLSLGLGLGYVSDAAIQHLLISVPLTTISYAVASSALKSDLNFKSKELGSVGSTLATLDVAMNIVGVFAPQWRAAVMRFAQVDGEVDVTKWAHAGLAQWTICFLMFCAIYLWDKITVKESAEKGKKE